MMGDKIKIVVVDDHPLFRDGVVYTLQTEPDFEVVGQGITADEAVRLVGDILPDLVLLDIGIPGGGLKAAQTIVTTYPAAKIVMLTASTEEDNLMAALRAGAKAYVLKGVSARELVTILRGVWAGESYVAPALAAHLLSEMTNAPLKTRLSSDPLDQLTERERQILDHVAAGLSNKEIGQKLHLAEKTVKHYMTNVLQKLQVRNRVEVALLAQQRRRTQILR
jgi:two-component system nitrate/nitrite response regulator NarL